MSNVDILIWQTHRTMQTKNTPAWQGRNDGDDPSFLRWHQVVQTSGSLPILQPGQKGIAFLGFACDEGVRRNKGRTGAAEGPAALRKMCSNFPVHFDDVVFADAGDIVCEGVKLEEAQEALSARVGELLSSGYLPVLFGGGHEIAYPHERGIRRHYNDRIGIINFDAHFDLRQPGTEGVSSGTGFWQMAQDRAAVGQPFDYLAIGIQQNSNTRHLFESAASLGASYIPASSIHRDNREQVLSVIRAFIHQNDRIYLTTCLDVFSSAYAPGVSATAYNGLIPDAFFLECYREVLTSGKLAGADIAELNPSLDQDNRTAKLAASLVFEIVSAYFGC